MSNALQILTGNFETGSHQDFADPTELKNNFGDLFGYTVESGVAKLKAADGSFPAWHALHVGGVGTGIGEIINLAADTSSFGNLNGPWLGVSEGDETLWINAFLNVKTWRLHGNIEGKAVDLTTPAGTSRYGNLTGSGSMPARPYSGTRAPYGVRFDLFESSNNIVYNLQITLGTFVETPHAEWNSIPANTFVPAFFLMMSYGQTNTAWRVYSGGFSNTAGTLDTSIDVLGENVATYYQTGSNGSYSISLEASEFWDNSDTWYKG